MPASERARKGARLAAILPGVLWKDELGKEDRMRFLQKKNLAAPLLLLTVFLLTLLSRLVPFPQSGGEGGEVYLTVIVLNLMIFVLPAVFYGKLQGQGYIKKLNLRPIGLSRLPVIFFMFFAMAGGSILLNYILYVLGVLRPGEESSAGNFAFLSGSGFHGVAELLFTILAFAVIPAAAEEFMFRGVLMSEYTAYGGVCQTVLCSLAFAMAHFSVKQFPVYLFCGLLLTLTAYITRSVFASMLLHLLYNLFALFGESYVWGLIAQRNSTVFFIFIVGTVFLLFLMLAIGEGERLFYTYATAGIPAPKLLQSDLKKGEPRPITRALFSPTFLLCAALFLVTVLVQ